MPVLQPYELKPEGTYHTQASDPVTGHATVKGTLILNDEDILSADPLLRVTQLVIEQSVDGGVTWSSLAGMGSWESGPQNAPRNFGDPVPHPGVSSQVANDGKTRRFRIRCDFPQAILAGVEITVTQ